MKLAIVIVWSMVAIIIIAAGVGGYFWLYGTTTLADLTSVSTPSSTSSTSPTSPVAFFDPTCLTDPSNWYLTKNPDVKAANIDAFTHWKDNGFFEGRRGCWACNDLAATDPTCIADPKTWYLDKNPDVKASGLDAFDHWKNYGYSEKRSACFGCGP